MADPTVLLVTDSDEERDLYSSSLPLYGFRVICADAIEEVPDAVQTLRPDLIVLNIRLGAESTWEALEQIQCGGSLDVPGVLVTGSIRPDAANRLRARASGCAAFVATPCAPADLAAILRSVLSGQRGLTILRPEQFGSAAHPRPESS